MIPDKDVWLKVVKTGGTLEFFFMDNEGDAWTSAGKDTKIVPLLGKGSYKIGLFLKNWGGSVAQKAAFDYFNVPELNAGTTAVEGTGKLATTWSAMKAR